MKRLEIIVNGVSFPCYQTMGAILRFKQETGKEITEMDAGVSDLCTFLWCCIVSACKREKIEFGYTLMDFADAIGPDDLTTWANSIQQAEESQLDESGEKKSL